MRGARRDLRELGAVSSARSAGAATGSARESSRSISPASSRATSDSSPNARAIALSATPSSASPRSATAASKRSHSSCGPATRSRARAQLVGELHVAGARMRTVREPEQVGVTQRGGLLLGGVGDRRARAARTPRSGGASTLASSASPQRWSASWTCSIATRGSLLTIPLRRRGTDGHDVVGDLPRSRRRPGRADGLASDHALGVRGRRVGHQRAVDLGAADPPRRVPLGRRAAVRS